MNHAIESSARGTRNKEMLFACLSRPQHALVLRAIIALFLSVVFSLRADAADRAAAPDRPLALLLPPDAAAVLGIPDLATLRREWARSPAALALNSASLASWKREADLAALDLWQSLAKVEWTRVRGQLYGEWLLAFLAPREAGAASGWLALARMPRRGAEFGEFLQRDVFPQWPVLRPWHERAGDVFIFSPDPMTRAETRRRLAALDSPGAREAVAEFWSDSAHLCAWADSTAADWLAGAGGGAAPLLKTIAPLFAASPGTISASMRFSQDGARASVEWRRSAPSGAPASNAPVSFDTQAARAAPASASGLVEFALHDAGDAWRRIWPRLSGPQGWLAGGRARLDARWAALGLAIGELAQALDGHLALAAGGEPECPMYALLSLGVADRPLADQALEQRLAPAMAAFGSLGRATHRGVAYRLLTPPGAGRSMAWGFAGGRLLWASDEKALRRAIDSSLGAPALASRDSFQAVVRQASPAGASGFFFLDPNRAISALSPLGPLAAQQLGIPPAAAREWMLRMPNPEAIAPLFPAAGGVWTATERGWKADAFDGGGLAAHLGLAAPMLAGAWAPEPGRARTRAMLAAVDEDFLRIGQALERYRVDQGKYPMPTRVSPPGSVLAPDSRPRWMLPPAGSALALHDPFAPESGVSYGYFANEAGWILFSAGPDNKYDIRPDEDFIPERGGAWPPLYWKTYDPTNGAASAGDIWMTAH